MGHPDLGQLRAEVKAGPVWKEHSATALCLLALAALNAWILGRLFKIEYTPWMGSIEGAYVGLSRWLQGHWTDVGWFPLWYGGIPLENAYPPLLHVLVAAVSQAAGISVARAHHVTIAVMYCLGPAVVFWLLWRLSGSRWKAFLAGWICSLVSPSAFLQPSVARDVTSVWQARRMQAMVGYGEGPHVTSMTLLVVALACLHAALENPAGWSIAVAAIAVAAVALTNWLGAFALACGVLALAMSRKEPRLGRIVTVGLIAYALAAPWLRPSTVTAVQRNATRIGGYSMGLPQYVYLALWLSFVAAAGLWLRRTQLSEASKFVTVFLLLMAIPPLGFEWFHMHPIPQPDRYHLEMEFAIAMGAGLMLGRKSKWMISVVTVAMILLTSVQAPRWRAFARMHLDRFDVTKTVEWEAARWLESNLPGRRVFVMGSTMFWLNAFTDSPQLGGGFDQGRLNPVVSEATFAVPFTRGDGAATARLLQAFGVEAVLVGGERTRDAYRNYSDPGKFAGVLPELWRSGDDVIYAVPTRSHSLAHVLAAGDVVPDPGRTPETIERYVTALDNGTYPVARFEWLSASRARVQVDLRQGQVVSLQINWDSGWHARAGGSYCALRRDGLGLIVTDPGREGRSDIELYYDGGIQGKIARVLCGLGFACCVWLCFGKRGAGARLIIRFCSEIVRIIGRTVHGRPLAP